MKPYQTKNLYESSYLAAIGFKLIGKDSLGPKTTLFFQETPELREAVIDFYNGDGIVSAKAFVDNFRNMKDLCCQIR